MTAMPALIAPLPPVDKSGTWVAPRYTVTRRVELNSQHLEEHRCVAFRADAAEMDRYRILRTRMLQRMGTRGGSTLMVTSALPGEGKTLTAINLALAFARGFEQTVLLVDCNLRRPRIHECLGYGSELGLADYLAGDTPISAMMVWPGVEKLTVISGGCPVEESAELLGSPRMQALVQEMKQRYPDRFVIFDVPAVLAGADALAFAPLVDHILITVRADRTPLDQVERALALLPRDKVLGTVLNGER
jgi:non-specific protein-tyrosine kinase